MSATTTVQVAIVGGHTEQLIEDDVNARMQKIVAGGAFIDGVQMIVTVVDAANGGLWYTATITYWPGEPEAAS